MSLIPMLFSNWWEDLEHPHRIRDQHFGRGLHAEHLLPENVLLHPSLHARRNPYPSLAKPRSSSHYYRPWSEMLLRNPRELEALISGHEDKSGISTIKSEKDQFQVVLDVQQFLPEEITVKVVDKFVVVEGDHKEKRDEHGWISRKFTRKYLVPDQCDLDQVSSELSSDGVLKITVARKQIANGKDERIIRIQTTGKPAVQESAHNGNEGGDKK